MKNGHTAPDLWHLTIDDLLSAPPETPRLGGSGPFVINLSSSTAPIGVPTERFPGFEQLRIYQVKRTENNRWRYRLRIGLINTELEADAILSVVRERYPSAFTATAGDDDLRAVSEASRKAQARKAHATEMIADKPDDDVEAPKAVAPKAVAPKAAAPVVQPAQPTRWIVMQAPEKKTPSPREETDVDPNAVTDQVAILKLPEGETGAELTLDDIITPPPVAPPKAEARGKPQAAKNAKPPAAVEPPKPVEPKKPAPPKAAEAPKRPTPRPMKEIEAELRPLFEPTRKAAPTSTTVTDLQAIADLVVIDRHDTLESVVLKNNARVDSLAERVEVEPLTVTATAEVAPRVEAPLAAKPAADLTARPETEVELVPELAVDFAEPSTPLALAAIRAAAPPVAQPATPPIAQPAVIEGLDELPLLTEVIPVVTQTRAPVINSRKQVSQSPATSKTSEPPKVVEPPVLTAAVFEPPAKPVEPKKSVESSAHTAKVTEPPAKKIVEPVAKVVETAKAVETPKTIETKAAEPTRVELPRTVKAQLVTGGGAQAIKAASKSHRAIARMAKVAAKQAKAQNRVSKESAKAAKVHTHKAAPPPRDVEQTAAVTAVPPTATTQAPSVAAAPPKPEHHQPNAAARQIAAPPPKAPSPAHKTAHSSKANSHAALNGHAAKANGSPRELNGHSPAPTASTPAPNGHVQAAAKPAPGHNGHSHPINGRAPAPAPAATPTAQPTASIVAPPVAVSEPAAKPIEILSEPLPSMDSTQTIRALTPLELTDDDESARWYSIQLSLSEDEVNPESIPHLDIFDEYRLYSVAGLDQGRFVHALRLGFFTDEGAAQAVAGYLRCFFEEPSVKRVSVAERERFAERRVVARKDVGATGTHTIVELATAAPVRETTLADLSHSAIRHTPEDSSLLSRLDARRPICFDRSISGGRNRRASRVRASPAHSPPAPCARSSRPRPSWSRHYHRC
jgi:hypothetical protein